MQITTDIKLNLKRPNVNTIVHAKQNDKMTRKVVAKLMDGEQEWTPPSGSKVSTIRYRKQDGHVGFYDTDEKGNAAVTYSGSTATIMLAEQALTCHGIVFVELNIYTSAGEKLTTFQFVVDVEESAVTDGEIISTDYFNILSETITQLLEATEEAMEKAAAIAGMTATAQEAAPGAGTYVVVTGGTGAEDPYVLTFYIEPSDIEEINDRINDISEEVEKATITDEIQLHGDSGIYVTKEETYKIKITGTGSAVRRFLCLNGQNDVHTTTEEFLKTIPYGRYKFRIIKTGHSTDNRNLFVGTYGKFGTPEFGIKDGDTIDFSQDVMIGFISRSGTDYGTEEDPTYVEIHITKLTAVDEYARKDTQTRFPLRVNESIDIQAGTDFNDLKNPGSYYVASFERAQTLENIPYVGAGRMIVITTTHENRIIQIYFSNTTTSAVFIRSYTGSWSIWREVARKDYVDTAITDMLNISIKYANFDGGTLLGNQTVNTVCRVSNKTDVTDAPEGFDLTRYYWMFTIGNSNIKMQLIVYSSAKRSGNFIYWRFNNGSGWADWRNTDDSDVQNKPKYVAIGASTVEGRIHHKNGQSTTVSENAYPQLVGKALGLETFNFAIGSTGFMARGTENQTLERSKNFCDVIYEDINSAGSKLKQASLVTLQFGYGNDQKPAVGDPTVFPIGHWDDYYPFDEPGYRIRSETKAAILTDDILAMLDKGATLMGCLNWCIRYISTNCPKAQIIVIYGAPSANNSYPINVVNNESTEAYSVAPKKITVTPKDPTSGLNGEVNTLAERLGLCLIDEFNDSNPFNYYNMHVQDENGNYVIFSTTGTDADPSWNSHPNDEGYLMYARFKAGKIISLFNNRHMF